jgi:hypothetical protein
MASDSNRAAMAGKAAVMIKTKPKQRVPMGPSLTRIHGIFTAQQY